MTDPKEVVDHERIWLEADCEGNALAGEGRTWCAKNVYDPCPDCGATATEYVRADLYEALSSELERVKGERDAAQALAERLKLEAQGHACEARTANSTIYEIYQVLSGGTGEPGNWNGARPAREYVARAEASLGVAVKALEELVDSLTPAEEVPSEDPAFGDQVRALGVQIGFGALMSSASHEWHRWLVENGYPEGSEFVSGPCRAVLQSDLRAARSALASIQAQGGVDGEAYEGSNQVHARLR